MQKPFTTQSALFVSESDMDHSILRNLDDTEMLLDWSQVETLLSPSIPLKQAARVIHYCRYFGGYYGLAAMAANLRKGAIFLTLYGLPDLALTG